MLHSARRAALSQRVSWSTRQQARVLPTRAAAGGPTQAAGGPPAPQPVTSAYIHLPFCKRKCFYCDFPVEAVGVRSDRPVVQDRVAEYVSLLIQDIASQPLQASAPHGAPLQTVYFGGGTPSLVPPSQLGRILDTLQQHYGVDAAAEVTLEADPGTFDLDRLLQYKALGVTRISMGVQSFQQHLLEACGRSHNVQEIAAAIAAVKAAGFRAWNLDLISGLPHLTEADWQQSLEAAVAAGPDHISVYDLQVEEGTPFGRWYTPGQQPLPPEEAAVRMYRMASSTLTAAGYEHYEVSNYAKPGKRCRHNAVYWSLQPYYGWGLGAASYLARRRLSRTASMKQYRAWVEAGGAAGVVGVEEDGGDHTATPTEEQHELLLDTLMLRLRTADGLDMQQVQQDFGQHVLEQLGPVLDQHAAAGRVQLQDAAGSSVLRAIHAHRARLSDPDGFLLSNAVISDLFAALDAASANATP